MLLIVTLQFYKLSKNGIGDLVVHWFGYLAQSGHWEKWVSTLVGYLIFPNNSVKPKIDDLATCLEIRKTWNTEFQSRDAGVSLRLKARLLMNDGRDTKDVVIIRNSIIVIVVVNVIGHTIVIVIPVLGVSDTITVGISLLSIIRNTC